MSTMEEAIDTIIENNMVHFYASDTVNWATVTIRIARDVNERYGMEGLKHLVVTRNLIPAVRAVLKYDEERLETLERLHRARWEL